MFKSKIALIALASVCTGLAVAGCSSQGSVDATEGQEDLDLQAVDFNLSVGGALVQTVEYVVAKDGTTVKEGTFEVPGDDDSFSLQLLLPVGTGYSLSISGDGSKEGRTIPCAGSAGFTVVAGSNPPVDVTVTCTDTVVGGNSAPPKGSVQANVDFVLDTVIQPGEECGFTHAVVGPLVQQVGSKIDLKSQYLGNGAVAGWSATGVVGTFGDASADDTTFTCDAVSSGSIAASLTAAQGCTDTFTVAVECIGTAVCGDGAVNQASEQCDDDNTTSDDGCSATCQLEPVVCGDNDVDAPEACDDGNIVSGDGCSATCQLEGCGNGTEDAGEGCDDGNTVSNDGCSATCQDEVCGDAIVNGSEACDDGNDVDTDACSNACTINPICGNGQLQAGEECDDTNNVNNDGCSAACDIEACGDNVLQTSENCDNCPADVIASGGTCDVPPVCGNGTQEAGETCDTCPADVAGGCDPQVSACSACLSANVDTAPYNDGQCNVDPLCVAVRDCIAAEACFVPTAGSQECLCGQSETNPALKADVIECGNPSFETNGPCSDEIKAGSPGSTTNVQLLERQFDFNYPGGIGFGILAFARDAGICTAECNMQ